MVSDAVANPMGETSGRWPCHVTDVDGGRRPLRVSDDSSPQDLVKGSPLVSEALPNRDCLKLRLGA